MYKIVGERWFNSNKKYSEIDFQNFREVVDNFEIKIKDWYIDQADLFVDGKETSKDAGFAISTFSCLLIDCLSQYEAGEFESCRSMYIDYLKAYWNDLGVSFSIPINTTRGNINNVAEAIYSGLRCGILHEANVAIYVGLGEVSGSSIYRYEESGDIEYVRGVNCPFVLIDPNKLYKIVRTRFYEYIDELKDKDAKYNNLREKFKKKFDNSFGQNISIVL